MFKLYTNPEAQKVSGFFVLYLSVVQPGRMPALGAGGREFDPLHSDQKVVDRVLKFDYNDVCRLIVL